MAEHKLSSFSHTNTGKYECGLGPVNELHLPFLQDRGWGMTGRVYVRYAQTEPFFSVAVVSIRSGVVRFI